MGAVGVGDGVVLLSFVISYFLYSYCYLLFLVVDTPASMYMVWLV